MFRWEIIAETTINGRKFKMYRPPFRASRTQEVDVDRRELDQVAFDSSLNTELLTYRILDVNFVRFMEERGDPDRLKKVLIPIEAEEETL